MFKVKFSSPQTSFYCHVDKIKFLAPHSKTLRFSIVSYHFIIALVVSLFRSCGPFYIPRKIALRIVDSVKRVLRSRTFRNFFFKGGKISPRSVQSYSAPTIVFVRCTRRTLAALNDIMVKSIKFCRTYFSFMPMFKIHTNGHIIGWERCQ